MEQTQFDYIVVGGGSSGSIAAAKIAKFTQKRVLLIDAGISPDRIPEIWNPYDSGKLTGMESLWWHGYQTPKYSGSNETAPVIQAKVLGGNSSLNSMVYSRGAPTDYNRWANVFHCPGWSYNEIENDFSEIENRLKPTTGEKDELGSAFISACNEQGIAYLNNYDTNTPLNGVSPMRSSISESTTRETSFHAFVQQQAPKNLTVIDQALVSRILFTEDRATGIEFVTAGKKHKVSCKQEIILSAGALNSPKILMLSGIGDKAQLNKLGIPVLLDSPHVGQHLQNALLFNLHWKTSRPLDIAPTNAEGNRRNLGYAIAWTNLNEYQQPQTCIELIPGLYNPNQSMEDLRQHFTLTGGAMRLKSRGWVKLASSQVERAPLIESNFLADPQDLQQAVDSFNIVRSIANSPAMKVFRAKEITPGRLVVTQRDIEEWIMENVRSYCHHAGSCRMGESIGTSVVAPDLRVHGIQNLRVADASVMPEITSGHTQAPAFLIGLKVAKFIKIDSDSQ